MSRLAHARVKPAPRVGSFGLIAAFWATLGAMDIGQLYLRFPKPLPPGFADTVIAAASAYAALALLTPVVFELLGRYPLGRSQPARSLAVIALMGALFPVVHLSTGAVLVFLLSNPRVSYFAFIIDWLGRWYVFDLFRFLALVGFYYAVRNRQAARERLLAVQRHRTRAARLQAQLAQARLATLNRQLQPHFLFNALNAISSLAYQGDTDRAIRMIARLSDLLRVSLETNRPTTTLAEELTFLASYLDIEKIRFEDHLKVVIDVPAELRDAEVPPLALQTLAENAVRHGISLSVVPAALSIRARRQDDMLMIEIADTGIGLTLPFRPGIGLRNTRARIRALYGRDARLLIQPRPERGTIAQLILPLRFAHSAAP
jgi:two-component system, LytTR family, sensor kinase